jgi:hypothetical protein
MHRHVLAKRRHLLREMPLWTPPAICPPIAATCRGSPRTASATPSGFSFCVSAIGESCRGVQNLVRVSVADAAEDARIRQRPFEGTVLVAQGLRESPQDRCKDIDAARIDGVQRIGASQHVQGCAALRSRLGQHQRAVRKIERRQIVASRELGAGGAPVQPSGNHEMDDQPQIVVEANGHTFADSLKAAHGVSLHRGERRFGAAQQECAGEAHLEQRLADDSLLERADIRGNVG